MRFLLLLLTLISFVAPLSAQKLQLSAPQKLSSKTPYFQILGKNNEGIIIYKHGKGINVVEALNSNMVTKWKKNLSIKQSESDILKMVLYPDKTIVFFIAQSKSYAVLYAQLLDNKFSGGGKFIQIDTLHGTRFDIEDKLKVIHSQDKSKLVAYFPQYGSGGLNNVKAVGFDEELEILFNEDIPMAAAESNYKLEHLEIDNEGDLYILLEHKNRSRKKNAEHEPFNIYRYSYFEQKVELLPFKFDRPVFGSMQMKADNVNRKLVASCFYTDDEFSEAYGVCFQSMDLETTTLSINSSIPFSHDLMYKITGKDSTRNHKGLSSFNLSDAILRFDGGAILVAESRFDNAESQEVPSFVPSAGPSYRTINVTYYNDIVLLSVAPDGTEDWHNVLRKKQMSEDDDGFYSSFSLMTLNDQLRFVYNEDIYYKTNVNEYILNHQGKVNRKLLFNAGEKNILLVPRLGRQISNNEIVMPSFRKNYVRFVKLTY